MDDGDSKSSSSQFDVLCNDALAHVLSYVDFKSAVRFARGTAKSLTKRIVLPLNENDANDDMASFEQVWRDMYFRHHFSPIETPEKKRIDYVDQCRNHRKLFDNLMGRSKKKGNRSRSCFNLPNRYFYFVPVTPDDEDDMEWEDSPPVDFTCKSFVLTSTGVGGELLFLNPFDGSLSVYDHCLDNAVKSDEAMMEQAMLDAASMIVLRRDNLEVDERDEHVIAGTVIDESVYRNHNIEEYRTAPSQTLLDRWMQDYLDENLLNYFNDDVLGRGQAHNMELEDEDAGNEIVIDYVGIDSKPILTDENTIKGTMIAAGRTLSNEADTFEDERVCTETLVWKRVHDGSSTYQERLVCRIGWSFHTMDMCATYNRVYVVFYPGNGPRPRENEEMEDMEDSPFFRSGRRTIVAYPLLPYERDTRDSDKSATRYFPEPELYLNCRHSVSSVVVDSTGETVLAGTANGTIEVWEISQQPRARRLSTLDIATAVMKSARRFNAQKNDCIERAGEEMETSVTLPPKAREDELISTCEDVGFRGLATEMEVEERGSSAVVEEESPTDNARQNETLTIMYPSAPTGNEELSVSSAEPNVPRLNASRVVESIHFPLHCPVEKCGFFSMQHDRSEGTTLLLWKREGTNGPAKDFQVVSLINLPLSPQRMPQVCYDGRRLVVLGQDHIGMIILVYHVLSTWEDIDSFDRNKSKKLLINRGDDSAGLYNLTDPTKVTFANRIRHAGLGGLEYYDSIYMTCNERFIVVNTKTGSLVGGDSGAGEGLLIIDLEDHA